MIFSYNRHKVPNIFVCLHIFLKYSIKQAFLMIYKIFPSFFMISLEILWGCG